MKSPRHFKILTILVMLAITVGACVPQATPTAQPAAAVEPTAAPPANTEVVASPTEAAVQPTAVAAQPTQPAAQSSEVTEIVYQRYSDNPEDIEMQFVNEFNASHPNIHVTVDSVPAVDAYQKILLTTEAGTPPDVFMTHFTISSATAGLALDLTPLVQAEGDAWNSSYSPVGWLFHDYAGKHYAMPWRVAEYVIFFNNQLLKKAGLELPKGDWTWDDFLNYAKKMTDPTNDQYGFCFVGAADNATTNTQFGQFLVAAGGKHIGDDGLANFTNEATYKTFDFLTSMIYDSKVVPPGIASTVTNTCTDLLAAGKVGMWSNADLWRGTLRSKYKGIDISVYPSPKGEIKATWVGGTGLAISSKSKHAKEAWEFIKYLTSDDVMRRWSKASGFIPPNLTLWKDPAWLAEDPEREVLIKSFGEYKAYPLDGYPEGFNLQTILRNYIQAVYLKSMTPQQAMEAATKEWNKILVNYQQDNWWAAWK
jgi:ABC-type glycerol-3-phosphate transport system substrate-binding protein